VIIVVFACACGSLKHGQVEDLVAVPQRGQSEGQRRQDWNACAEKISGAAPLVSMIYIAVERAHFKDCMKERGYTLEDNPTYVAPRPR